MADGVSWADLVRARVRVRVMVRARVKVRVRVRLVSPRRPLELS